MDRAFLEDITREAGGLALELLGRVRSEKKGASLVSEADRAVERGIVSRIRSEYPDDFILAEESGTSGSDGPSGLGETTRWWSVDPIDGTGPYLATLPFWAVSVACMRGSRAEGGAVFLPAMSDMFSAVSGGPAPRNGAPLPPLRPAPARLARRPSTLGLRMCARGLPRPYLPLSQRLYPPQPARPWAAWCSMGWHRQNSCGSLCWRWWRG